MARAAPYQELPRGERAVEMTFLRSHADDPASVVEFIRRNWFVLDEEAKQQGLISRYEVFAELRGDKPWNVVVIVRYAHPDGYEAVRDQFEAIRTRHTPVVVDGATDVRELAQIVETRRLQP